MDALALSERIARAKAALRDLEQGLAQRHGVCRIEVELEVGQGVIRLSGAVLVDRLRARVMATVAGHFPQTWVLEDRLEVVQGGPWHAVERALSLRASMQGGAVVTVVHPDDGPLECLGTAGTGALVRDRYGTAAWASLPLGALVSAPALPEPRASSPTAFVDAARAFVDTPYRLGGTDRAAIDCSGLVQRAAWTSQRIALPRNTGDLWALGARPGRPPGGAGHLVFVWTQGETLRHVGIVTDETVVHASLSRQRVVEDSNARFYANTSRVEHVPFSALRAHGERCAGAPNILAAGVRLGQVAPTAPIG